MYGYGTSANTWEIIIWIILGSILIFLILREFFCWYWKLNKIAALLEEQNILLSNFLKNSISQATSIDSINRKIIGNKIQKRCTRCKKEVDMDFTACPHCGNNSFI
ncbi:MAG: hypothetical protein FWF29_01510 [Treponema sp.]|nr:hypothetical protein [Treponema sp.]